MCLMIGSPKKQTPARNVLVLTNVYADVSRDAQSASARTVARRKRGLSSGKGGVGESALPARSMRCS